MLTKPLVSVSVPTMNSGQSLALCLRAVKNQTYSKIEVNLVDGGSKDNTVEIAKSHGVHAIETYPGALLGARELGARIANGEVVVFLDSDKLLDANALETAVSS